MATLIRSVPGAAWLPAGSTAEVWAGADVEVPEPAVIVRLLVRRGTEVFCVRTAKGFDLPTVFLGQDGGWRSPADGIAGLAVEHLGAAVEVRCVGYVRNVVPVGDADYRFPLPYAHVPVFTPRDPTVAPLPGKGTWISAADAPGLLGERHWWPIAGAAVS